MEQSGVEFVIDNLGGFVAGMEKAQGATGQLTGALALLQGITNVGSTLTSIGLAASILAPEIGAVITVFGSLIYIAGRLAETIGGVVGKAINFLISALKGLYDIASTILRPITNFVGGILNAINPLRIVGDLIDRIAYISMGILVADVFRSLSRGFVEMGKTALQGAMNLQLLTLRLQGLVARDIFESWDESTQAANGFGQALEDAIQPASELYDWIVQQAAITPFTIESITNVMTLAKSYGFATDMAKRLTLAIGDFVAGMGLSEDVMERIITNFGQMFQQGKITGTEMRDLARGAFVPLTAVLEELGSAMGMSVEETREWAKTGEISNAIAEDMAEQFGMTTEELAKFAETGQLDVMAFMESFIRVVERDFPDAMKRMFQTIPGIMSGVKDLLQAYLGGKVFKPVMDFLAAKLAPIFIDIFKDPRLSQIFEELGQDLTNLVDKFWPDDISGDSIMDTLYNGYLKIREVVGFLSTGELTKALESLGVPQWVIDTVNNLLTGFESIKTFWEENKDDLSAAVGEFLDALGIDVDQNAFVNLSAAFIRFGDWLNEEGPKAIAVLRDEIIPTIDHFVSVTVPNFIGALTGARDISIPAEQYEGLGRLAEAMQTIDQFAIGFGEFLDKLGQVISMDFSAFRHLAESMGMLSAVMGGENGEGFLEKLGEFFLVLLSAPAPAIEGLAMIIERLAASIDAVKTGFGLLKEFIEITFTKVIPTLLSGVLTFIKGLKDDFASAGSDLGEGFKNGIIRQMRQALDQVRAMIQEMLATIEEVADIGSPSRVTTYYGEMLMRGLSKGIDKFAYLPTRAAGRSMDSTLQTVQSPVYAGASSNTTYNINMQANYAETQSPITVNNDLMALLAMLKR